MDLVSGTLASLALSALNDLLSYHIVTNSAGPVYSTNFTNASSLSTLEGSSLTIELTDNAYVFNSARIIASDLLLSNGVMHVIDTVLSPNSTNTQPDPVSATQAPVLATSMAGTATAFNSSAVPFTTDLPAVTTTVAAAAAATTGPAGRGGEGGNGSTSYGTGLGSENGTDGSGEATTSSSSGAGSALYGTGLQNLISSAIAITVCMSASTGMVL